MKYIATALLAGLVCLAPASLYAQNGTQKTQKAETDPWESYLGIVSGATGTIDGEGERRGGAALVGGIYGVRLKFSPNFALGTNLFVGWTGTNFFSNRRNRRTASFVPVFGGLVPVAVPQEDLLVYDFKYSTDLRVFWDWQIRELTLNTFALVGYQYRRALTYEDEDRRYLAKNELEHGYLVGLGWDQSIIPTQPNVKLRFEYAFSQNFGNDGHVLSAHDIVVGALYYF